MQQFSAVIEAHGKTATGIEVPPEVVEALGPSRRPKVRATVAGHTYRSSVASMGGRFLLGVSAEVRRAANVAAGEVVVPDDFADALAAVPAARAFFDGLSYSQRRWFVLGIEEAKKPETRVRRIDKAVARLAEGRGQT